MNNERRGTITGIEAMADALEKWNAMLVAREQEVQKTLPGVEDSDVDLASEHALEHLELAGANLREAIGHWKKARQKPS